MNFPKMIYITRDNKRDNNGECYDDMVDFWKDKPERKREDGRVFFDSDTCEFTALPIDDFRKIFGRVPRKGTCSFVMPLLKKI